MRVYIWRLWGDERLRTGPAGFIDHSLQRNRRCARMCAVLIRVVALRGGGRCTTDEGGVTRVGAQPQDAAGDVQLCADKAYNHQNGSSGVMQMRGDPIGFLAELNVIMNEG